MIAGVFEELSHRVAKDWGNPAELSGLSYVAMFGGAWILGHRDWYDVSRLAASVEHISTRAGSWSTIGGATLIIAVLLAGTTAAGLGARLFGLITLAAWLGNWPWPLSGVASTLTQRRRERWLRLQERFEVAAGALPQRTDEARAVARQRNRIAISEPQRPTWMGDRFAAVETRVAGAYGLDLASCWPRLWLIVDDATRKALAAARANVDRAAILAGWALLYLLPALLWWPAAIIAALIACVAWRAARHAIAIHADLIESVVDLHSVSLARALTIPCEGPMSAAAGREVTRLLRKGS